MEPKDFLYAGVVAMSAMVFFLMGLYCARKRIRHQSRFPIGVPFNDSGSLTELSEFPEEPRKSSRQDRDQFCPVPTLTLPQIRARFGNN